MVTCRQASDYANRRLDGELGLLHRFSLRLHLAYCANCRRFVRQLGVLRSALRRMHNVEPVGDEFVSEVLEAIRRQSVLRPGERPRE